MDLIQTIERLEELAKVTASGPWNYDHEKTSVTALPRSSKGSVYTIHVCETGYTEGQYIAAANPETILKLCAAVRGMRMALSHWEKEGCCGDAMDGDYLGDHLIEIQTEALSKVDAMFEEVRG